MLGTFRKLAASIASTVKKAVNHITGKTTAPATRTRNRYMPNYAAAEAVDPTLSGRFWDAMRRWRKAKARCLSPERTELTAAQKLQVRQLLTENPNRYTVAARAGLHKDLVDKYLKTELPVAGGFMSIVRAQEAAA